jgi:hypothetical protein
MARKLNWEEKRLFADAIRESSKTDGREEEFLLQHLSEQHETALKLTPELGAWFALEMPGRMRS